MLNYHQFMVPRLNGLEISKRFSHYRALVKKGVAGFIIFGGELETVREYIGRLQNEARLPLVISADLERGLGQQLKGGTHFPPAMALGSVFRKVSGDKGQAAALRLIGKSFKAVALEARYAGINTVFAPVLDINTNPDNPIIAARAFGEAPALVAALGREMIITLQKNGIAACGKHFPGHGDTGVDSHIKLPVLRQSIRRLKQYELKPFAAAVKAGVSMIMSGHLSVPALDPSGLPVSLSEKAVRFLRNDMGYSGLLVTDALNMGGIGRYSEEEAACMALEAGMDILLHPSDPDKLAAFLRDKKIVADPAGLAAFRRSLKLSTEGSRPLFGLHGRLSGRLTKDAVFCSKGFMLKGNLLFVIVNDDEDERGAVLRKEIEMLFPGARIFILKPGTRKVSVRKGPDEKMVLAVFSDTRAWKGGASPWLFRKLSAYREVADLLISFGSPYLLSGMGSAPCLYVYWDADEAQKAAAGILKKGCKKVLHEK